MKTIIFSLFLLLSHSVAAQKGDSMILRSEKTILVQNLETKRFKLTNIKTNEFYGNLNFAKSINQYYQILDSNNQLFYVSMDWEKKEKADDYFLVCGTVPHYTMKIKQHKAFYEVLEDETFFDYKNKEKAEVTAKVKRSEAESVVFINGKSEFEFTSNFDVGIGNTDPRMLILVKDGKYFTPKNPEVKYDSIDFSNYGHSLKTKQNNLYGILGVIEPKYKEIGTFTYNLAKATTTDNEHIFIDIEGNEYRPTNSKSTASLLGDWGIYAHFVSGVVLNCNVCPRIEFTDSSHATLTLGNGNKKLYNWSKTADTLTLRHLGRENAETYLPSANYEITFTIKEDCTELVLSLSKKNQYILRK